MYRGAIPHFTKIHTVNINHTRPIESKLVIDLELTRYVNTCSIKNQSNVRSLV